MINFDSAQYYNHFFLAQSEIKKLCQCQIHANYTINISRQVCLNVSDPTGKTIRHLGMRIEIVKRFYGTYRKDINNTSKADQLAFVPH